MVYGGEGGFGSSFVVDKGSRSAIEMRLRCVTYFWGAFLLVFLPLFLLVRFVYGVGVNGYRGDSDEVVYYREYLLPHGVGRGGLDVEVELGLWVSVDGVRRGVRRELPRVDGYGEEVAVTVKYCERDGEGIECKVKDEEDGRFLYIGEEDKPLVGGMHRFFVSFTVSGVVGDVEGGMRGVRWVVLPSSFSTRVLEATVFVDLQGVRDGREVYVNGYVHRGGKLIDGREVKVKSKGGVYEVSGGVRYDPGEEFTVDLFWK